MVAAARIRKLTDAAPPRVDGLITIKGVLDVVERQEDAEQAAARSEAMLKSLDGALMRARRRARRRRRAPGGDARTRSSTRSSAWCASCRPSPARTREAIEQRLKEQVGRLLEAGNGFDPAAPASGGGAAGHARRCRGGAAAPHLAHRAPRASC